MSNKSVRDALDGSVRCTAREPAHEPRIHGAEADLPGDGAPAQIGHVLQGPHDLRAGKIGIEEQARAPRDCPLQTAGVQRLADLGRAAVLPYKRRAQRRASLPVPEHRGLALIRYSDGRDAPRLHPCLRQRLARSRKLRVPDLFGVVLDPAGPGIVLRKRFLGEAQEPSLFVEDDRAGAGSSLVECEDAIPHAGDYSSASRFARSADCRFAPRSARKTVGNAAAP